MKMDKERRIFKGDPKENSREDKTGQKKKMHYHKKIREEHLRDKK